MRVVETASALLIGSELLSGKVQEANLHALATTLRSLGINLQRVNIVPDTLATIVADLRTLEAQHDLVVTSGGVGPTHDDLTMQAVSEAFHAKLYENQQLVGKLQRVYRDRLTPAHLRMALVPEGANVVVSDEVPWPTIVLGKVWILPGVPELFKVKLLALREQVRGKAQFHTRAVFTKLDEGELKPLLDRIVANYPDVDVGSYPKWFDPSCTTKVTLDGTSKQSVDDALRDLLALLPEGEPQKTA
jgi:molybdenum cofactor synthesis domain-containing protein